MYLELSKLYVNCQLFNGCLCLLFVCCFFLFDLPYQMLSFKRLLCHAAPPPSHSIPWIRIWGQRHGFDAVETEKKKTRWQGGDAAWWLHGPFSGFVLLVSWLGGFRASLLHLAPKWKRWRHGNDWGWGNQPGFHALISACHLWLCHSLINSPSQRQTWLGQWFALPYLERNTTQYDQTGG